MESSRIAPVFGVTMKGILCIDSLGTRAHEDGFRITKEITEKGEIIQLDLVAVIPPTHNIPHERLYRSLIDLLEYGGKYRTPFLDAPSRSTHGFNSHFPRTALVATIIINEKENCIFKEVALSECIATMHTFEEYDDSENCHEIITDLRKFLRLEPVIESYINQILENNLPKSASPAYQTTFITTQLFNAMCRTAANKKGTRIPFITEPDPRLRNALFTLNGGLARFNSCLRNPCALINSANLVSRLSGEEILPFPKEWLQDRFTFQVINKEPPKKKYKRPKERYFDE